MSAKVKMKMLFSSPMSSIFSQNHRLPSVKIGFSFYALIFTDFFTMSSSNVMIMFILIKKVGFWCVRKGFTEIFKTPHYRFEHN